MKARALGLAALLSVTFAASAGAASPAIGPLTSEQVDQALAVATAHWPANPCGGVFTVQASSHAILDPLYRGDDPAYDNGTAGDAIVGGAALGVCTVRIAADDPGWTQASLCDTLEHEIGHLLGLYHSQDPNDVMSLTGPLQADCVAAFPARKPAPAPAASQAPGSQAPAFSAPSVKLRYGYQLISVTVPRIPQGAELAVTGLIIDDDWNITDSYLVTSDRRTVTVPIVEGVTSLDVRFQDASNPDRTGDGITVSVYDHDIKPKKAQRSKYRKRSRRAASFERQHRRARG